MKKTLPIIIIAILLVGAGAFYGGMLYGKSQNGPGNFRGQRPDANFLGAGTKVGNGGGFTNGEVLSLDDKSITIKIRNNGSKIIFFSDATTVNKTVDGAISDLKVGDSIMVSGDSNSDGSISAKQIQLSPNLPLQPDMQQPPDSNVNQAQ